MTTEAQTKRDLFRVTHQMESMGRDGDEWWTLCRRWKCYYVELDKQPCAVTCVECVAESRFR